VNHTELLNAAIAWHGAGVVALPVRTDGSKAPALQWKNYQAKHPTLDELLSWYGGTQFDGLGVLTGAISGNLEMVELEGRAVLGDALPRLREFAADNDAADLLTRVMDGYMEYTPSGGLHILYRISDGLARRNTKLARTAERQVLSESRGEGGFVVVAPSFGRSHITGTAWTMESGGIETVATITADERDLLWALLRMLDEEQPAPEHHATAGVLAAGSIAGTRPGDDYDAKTTWQDILIPLGWKIARRMGDGFAWVRPGKEHGISATTGQASDGIDRLYVFSSSTDFESEKPYTKFAAYTFLEHGGDFSAAARQLGADGFGSQPAQSTTATPAPSKSVAAHISLDQMPDINNVAPDYIITTLADEIHEPAEPYLGVHGAVLSHIGDLALSPASTVAQSEDGHSQALIANYGADVRYCHQMGRWLHWDGSRWEVQPHGGGIVREYAKNIARLYPDDKEWTSHKKRSLTTPGINGALSMSTTDFRIEVSVNDLDARPWELNTPAGIVNLRTGELHPSDPTHLHTKTTAFAPDFTADQTPWTQFLGSIFQGDAEMIAYIQRLMGYACVGEVREAILPVFYGQGANGKTVLLETVQAVLGDYATVAPQRFLVQGPGQHATEIAAIAGARLVIASETNEGEKFDEAKVKILTGGDKIKARFMRQDEFTFKPSHLLVMMTNHRPEVGSGGTSFWRRLREIPFTYVVPESERDPELTSRLTHQHGQAIMAWLAQGAADYAANGLREPEKVKAATKGYEASTDTVGRFVEEMCIIGGGEYVKSQTAKMRDTYESWCRAEGETPVSARAFTMQITSRFGIGKSRDMRARYYSNVSLVGSGEDDE